MLVKRLEEILKEEDYIEDHPKQFPAFFKLAKAIAEKNFADNEVEAAVFIEFALDANMIDFLYTSKGETLHYTEINDIEDDTYIIENGKLETYEPDEYIAYIEDEKVVILESDKAREFYKKENLSKETEEFIKMAIDAGQIII